MKRNWTAVLALCLLTVSCSKANKNNLPEATLEELNRAMRAWGIANPAPLAQVSDLTNFPSLRGKRLPTPPPGKKLALDPVHKQVVLIDE